MVHGCMVYTECAEMAAVSCGTSHASAVSSPLWCIVKKETCYKKLLTHEESCEHSESAREQRIALYKSHQQQQHALRHMVFEEVYSSRPLSSRLYRQCIHTKTWAQAI